MVVTHLLQGDGIKQCLETTAASNYGLGVLPAPYEAESDEVREDHCTAAKPTWDSVQDMPLQLQPPGGAVGLRHLHMETILGGGSHISGKQNKLEKCNQGGPAATHKPGPPGLPAPSHPCMGDWKSPNSDTFFPGHCPGTFRSESRPMSQNRHPSSLSTQHASQACGRPCAPPPMPLPCGLDTASSGHCPPRLKGAW